MRHPPHACPPSRPPCHDGVLLPRIIARETRTIQRLCTDLCLSPCPDPSQQLCALRPASAQPQWTLVDGPCAAPQLHITIPVCATLRNACGHTSTATGTVEVETPLPRCFGDLCQHTLFIQPQIRLLCAHPGCAPGCYHAHLFLTLELYLLSLEPCVMRPEKPACPQLPLYPPPMQ